MRAHLWYIINTDKGYWLDDKGVPLECHWVDEEGLTLASHRYTRVVARWLEVLAGYMRRPNLMVITFKTVPE